MDPYVQDTDFALYHGDVQEVLRDLPDESVDTCVTSPPYWGLRDYQTDGQIGLESSPEEYVDRMVEVFREVRRVLATHGTCWVNLGDSYATTPTGNRGTKSKLAGAGSPAYEATLDRYVEAKMNRAPIPEGLKQKDLVGVPWRVAFALQADGWYLRSDIIWSKPNPMPESVTDRPTKAHEYVFLLSKQPKYFFDQEAVREPAEWNRWGDQTNNKYEGTQSSAGWIKSRSKFELEMSRRKSYPPGHTTGNHGSEHVKGSTGGMPSSHPSGRNVRSVWEIATQAYAEAHFATFPLELPRRCISAGCPEHVCRTCGKPRERIIERKGGTWEKRKESGHPPRYGVDQPPKGLPSWEEGSFGEVTTTTVGFSDCGHDDYRPGVVLDPFMGSGTVAFVARELHRHSVGIELNKDYCDLIADRLKQLSLFA